MLPFDTHNSPGDAPDDGCGVARPGANLENRVARTDPGGLDHQCDNVGLQKSV